MLFFRILRHLLPTGRAWRLVVDRVLRRFFEGLGLGVPTAARAALDDVYDDLRPSTTRQITEWHDQFAIKSAATTEAQRQQLSAAWRARGGQSPSYIQATLQAAGFDVFVHEWWEPGSDPRVVRDPRDYTESPLSGTVQCGDDPEGICGNFDAQCDDFAANETNYLVNLDLTPSAPPPIPSDPDKWKHFLYIGGETFGSLAEIDPARLEEFKEKVLQICPSHAWVVLLISTGAIVISGFAIDPETGPDVSIELSQTTEFAADTSSDILRALAFYGVYGVAVGDDGRVLRSTDSGDTWSTVHDGDHSTVGTIDIPGVASDGAGGMVLIANQALTATQLLRSSNNGATWSSTTDALNAGITDIDNVSDLVPSNALHNLRSSIAYGGGRYVALVQQTGTDEILSVVSTDGGNTWSVFLAFADGNFFSHVRFLNDAFYFFASDTVESDIALFRSTDGETWAKTLLSHPGGSWSVDIAYVGDDTLVASTDTAGLSVTTSEDNGATWGALDAVSGVPSFVRLEAAGGRLYGFSDSDVYVSEDDGTTWDEVYEISNPPRTSALNGARIFTTDVDGSFSRILAYDIAEAAPRITGARTSMRFNGSGVGLAVGVETGTDEGFIARSTVAREWVDTRLSTLIPGLTDPLTGVEFVGNIAVAVGYDPDETNSLLALYSADAGVTWTRTATDLTSLEMSAPAGVARGVLVAYGGGRFVAVGVTAAGVFNAASSVDDGETWTAHADPLSGAGTVSLQRLHYLDGAFYAVMTASDLSATAIYRSVDGATWTDHALSMTGSGGALDVAYVDGTLIAVGIDNYVGTFDHVRWTSSDGTTWNKLSMSGIGATRIPYSLAVNESQLYVGCIPTAVDSDPSIHTSGNNGATWSAIADEIDLPAGYVVDLMIEDGRLTGLRSDWIFSSY